VWLPGHTRPLPPSAARLARFLLNGRRMRPLPLLLLLLAAVAPLRASAHLDLVFLLDTTGSMSGELREAKERVRGLTEALRASRPGERVRVGVVAYRDQGDAYLTRVSPLSPEVDVSYSFLATLTADGGGDSPEDVLAGLEAALHQLDWDSSPDTERQLFVVADAPPHLDYPERPSPEALIEEALRRRIVFNAIGCRSLSSSGISFFRRLAYSTEGSYQHIGRVRAEEDGLARAMLSALAPPAPVDTSLLPVVSVSPVGVEAVGTGSARGLQVLPFSEEGRCGILVELPPGLALSAPPLVRRGSEALHVRLSLTQGSGGRLRFAFSECLPLALPVRVSF